MTDITAADLRALAEAPTETDLTDDEREGHWFTEGFRAGRKIEAQNLTAAGRLVPEGGMPLTAEQVEDVRMAVYRYDYPDDEVREARFRLRDSLFPATEPAEESDRLDNVRQCLGCGLEKNWRDMVIWRDADGEGHWVHPNCLPPAPAVPAEALEPAKESHGNV